MSDDEKAAILAFSLVSYDRVDETFAKIDDRLGELMGRVDQLELSHYVDINRIDDRLERIERRLDLVKTRCQRR